MNIHDPNLATPKVTTGTLPSSRKVYSRPDADPDLRVPVREIVLSEAASEPPVPVYDTTGPYTDPDATIDVEQGLARARTAWVRERGGVEEYQGRPIQAGRQRQRLRQASRPRLPDRSPAVARGPHPSLPRKRGRDREGDHPARMGTRRRHHQGNGLYRRA